MTSERQTSEDLLAGRLEPGDDHGDLWYEVATDVFLNHWCSTYDEARQVLASQGGYLLPYRRQFVVVERGYVKVLGLDPDDPAWEAVGHDLAKPADLAAYRELVTARLVHRS